MKNNNIMEISNKEIENIWHIKVVEHKVNHADMWFIDISKYEEDPIQIIRVICARYEVKIIITDDIKLYNEIYKKILGISIKMMSTQTTQIEIPECLGYISFYGAKPINVRRRTDDFSGFEYPQGNCALCGELVYGSMEKCENCGIEIAW